MPRTRRRIHFSIRTMLVLVTALCGILALVGAFPELVVIGIPFAASIATIAFARASLLCSRRSAALSGIAASSLVCALPMLAMTLGDPFSSLIAGILGLIGGVIVATLYGIGYVLNKLVVDRPDKYYIESD